MSRTRDPFSKALSSIRGGLEAGVYRAGGPITIADEARRLGLSTTPIREALCWLCGEGLIERSPSGGFLAPSLDPAVIQSRFRLRRLLLSSRREDEPPSAPAGLLNQPDAARRLRSLWRWQVRSLGEAALAQAFERVNEQLARVRAAEGRLFPDLEEEAARILGAPAAQQLELTITYHQRRIEASPLLAMEAERDRGSVEGEEPL